RSSPRLSGSPKRDAQHESVAPGTRWSMPGDLVGPEMVTVVRQTASNRRKTMPRLNDRIAILTGGSGGIGRVTAERFLEEGASVVLVDLDEQALADTARALGQPERVLTVKADVTCEDDVKNYVQSTLDRF